MCLNLKNKHLPAMSDELNMSRFALKINIPFYLTMCTQHVIYIQGSRGHEGVCLHKFC